MTRIAIACFIALSACVALADPLKPELQLTLWGRMPVAEASAQGEGSVVFFLDDAPTLQIDLAWAGPSSMSEADLKDWWKTARIQVTDSFGATREIGDADIEILEARTAGRLVTGARRAKSAGALPDATFALFTIPQLPPGAYRVTATLKLHAYQLRSYEEDFSVRRGDENEPIRRLYLRKLAAEATTFDDFKRVQLELMTLEPRNSQLPEQIAIRSLNVARPEETRQWYRRAHEMRRANARNWERQRGKPTAEERQMIDADLQRLSAFDKLYDMYVARQGELQLIPFLQGREMTFAWVKPGEGLVGIVDLRNPTAVKPIARPR